MTHRFTIDDSRFEVSVGAEVWSDDANVKTYVCITDLVTPEQWDLIAQRAATVARRELEEREIRESIQRLRERAALLTRVARGIPICVVCGESDIPKLVVDHIHPKARGGSNKLENKQVLCWLCNAKKGTKTMSEWLGDAQ